MALLIRHNECGMCGGDLHPLGVLGHLAHYRCRQCGGQFSRELKKRKPKDDGKHGADRIPKEDLDAVVKMCSEGQREDASEKLSALGVKYRLKSYEVHHLAEHVKRLVAKGFKHFATLQEAEAYEVH